MKIISFNIMIFRPLTEITSLARISISKQKRRPIPVHLPFDDEDSKMIKKKIFHSLSLFECGVHVLYHPKRTIARSLYLDSLQKLIDYRQVNGVLIAVLPPPRGLRYANLMNWWKSNFISEKEKSTKISDLLRQKDRVAIVIDGIDEIEDHTMTEVDRFIIGLAENSVLTKRYTVLLSVNMVKFYRRVLALNGRTKIYPVHY